MITNNYTNFNKYLHRKAIIYPFAVNIALPASVMLI